MQHIYRHINHLANHQRRFIEALAADKDYSGAQIRTLHYLFSHQKETVYQKDLEKEFSFRASTATELLNSMEKNGLVQRVPSKEDARRKEIVLTGNAENYRNDIVESIEQLQQTLVKDIDESDLQTWLRVTEKMLMNFNERGKK